MPKPERNHLNRQQRACQQDEGRNDENDAQRGDHGLADETGRRATAMIMTLRFVGLERNAVQLEPVIDQSEAMLAGDALLQRLDLG